MERDYEDEFVLRADNGQFCLKIVEVFGFPGTTYGDEYNGFGGFIRDNQNIMFNIDLRTFAPQNRDYFWQAAQKALAKLKVRNEEQTEGIQFLLTHLLDMHKRIRKGEDPLKLTDMPIKAEPNEKLGPGW